nr:hypothetical protein [Tanacetum cinerariifolium]
EDPRSRLAGIFPPNIARPLHGVKLLGELASLDFDFYNELVMKRVAKTIMVMDVTSKINDPQCQHSFDVALYSSLKYIVTTFGPRFDDWQWRISTLPFAFGGLGTKLLRHTSIVASGPIFDDALFVFSTSMETDLLINPSEIAAPKLIKKITDIYFARVTKNAEPTFSLFPRQMALWNFQKEDHTSDWLRAVPISGLGQTMNADFVLGRAVIDVAQRICVKYMAKCAAIGYGFLSFSLSFYGN